jgi:hypothetical protein
MRSVTPVVDHIPPATQTKMTPAGARTELQKVITFAWRAAIMLAKAMWPFSIPGLCQRVFEFLSCVALLRDGLCALTLLIVACISVVPLRRPLGAQQAARKALCGHLPGCCSPPSGGSVSIWADLLSVEVQQAAEEEVLHDGEL